MSGLFLERNRLFFFPSKNFFEENIQFRSWSFFPNSDHDAQNRAEPSAAYIIHMWRGTEVR